MSRRPVIEIRNLIDATDYVYKTTDFEKIPESGIFGYGGLVIVQKYPKLEPDLEQEIRDEISDILAMRRHPKSKGDQC